MCTCVQLQAFYSLVPCEPVRELLDRWERELQDEEANDDKPATGKGIDDTSGTLLKLQSFLYQQNSNKFS